jgi:hypothetical protein
VPVGQRAPAFEPPTQLLGQSARTVQVKPLLEPATPPHCNGAHVADSYPLKFGAGFATKLFGFGACKLIIVTLMASGLDGLAGPVTVNLRDREVANALSFCHAKQLPAASALHVPAEKGVQSAVAVQLMKLHN